tara:strand:- start:596 stop:832 length:237 start_codon:yes stop_codon:yes gene_type:complete
MIKKELRLIKRDDICFLQKKNFFGVWVCLEDYLQGSNFKAVKYFIDKDLAILWYIEYYLKTNKNHVEILLTEVELIKS